MAISDQKTNHGQNISLKQSSIDRDEKDTYKTIATPLQNNSPLNAILSTQENKKPTLNNHNSLAYPKGDYRQYDNASGEKRLRAQASVRVLKNNPSGISIGQLGAQQALLK